MWFSFHLMSQVLCSEIVVWRVGLSWPKRVSAASRRLTVLGTWAFCSCYQRDTQLRMDDLTVPWSARQRGEFLHICRRSVKDEWAGYLWLVSPKFMEAPAFAANMLGHLDNNTCTVLSFLWENMPWALERDHRVFSSAPGLSLPSCLNSLSRVFLRSCLAAWLFLEGCVQRNDCRLEVMMTTYLEGNGSLAYYPEPQFCIALLCWASVKGRWNTLGKSHALGGVISQSLSATQSDSPIQC